MDSKNTEYLSSLSDFHRAREQADLQEILRRMRGVNKELLSYDDVRKLLKAQTGADSGLKDIPLDAIVGSVGRYTDFTRDFLPRSAVDGERWARVYQAVTSMEGVPPISVYQIGAVYFVEDGNHRVSVARQLGASHIQAYVTQVNSRVPLTPEVTPDELIVKAEYADFLEKTHLDEARPQADLTLTVPGQYPVLLEHIAVHRYFMGLEAQREIPLEEATADWYDRVYLPTVEVILTRGLLASLPGRTEADLYLWIAEHRAALEEELGWQIEPQAAAEDLVDQFSPLREKRIARLTEKVLGAVALNTLEPGPPPGHWRGERLEPETVDPLFHGVLAAINGEASGWAAFEQARKIADREGASLRALHVVYSEQILEDPQVQALREEFNRLCAQGSRENELSIAVGAVTPNICDRARWNDLVVVSLSHPPGAGPLGRLGSGLRELVQRCPCPLLVVPQGATELQHALLAFDGSPNAEEALFIAVYLAAHWGTALSVIVSARESGPRDSSAADSGAEDRITEDGGAGDAGPAGTAERARAYLAAHGVQGRVIEKRGPAAEVILETSQELGCDLILMGSYSRPPVMEMVLGSTVDLILRASCIPVLICR